MKKRPNVLFIYTDQHRYDALGSSGNHLIKTPHLDQLATESMVFDDCHVNCPLCVPSRVATWRGVAGMTSYSYTNDWEDHISPGIDNMAVQLKKAGYKTALIGKNHCFQKPEEAFDHKELCSHTQFDNPQSPEQQQVNESRKGKMYVPLAEDPVRTEDSITSWCCDRSLAYLKKWNESSQENPFFLWLSLPDPHPPFMVSEPYASLYDNETVPPPVVGEKEMNNKPFRHQLAQELKRREIQYPHKEDLDNLRKTYWGMVSQIDDGIGRIMNYMAKNGMLEDSIIVFTADHGEYLGDHNLIRKGATLYDCLTHVPLMISWKGKIERGRTKQLASNLDLYPTFMELLGISSPSGLQGQSLAPLLLGKKEELDQIVLSHFGKPGKLISPEDPRTEELRTLVKTSAPHINFILHDSLMTGMSLSIRNRDWTYVVTPGDVDELYDRNRDPHELRNLADNPEFIKKKFEMSHELNEKLIKTTFISEEKP